MAVIEQRSDLPSQYRAGKNITLLGVAANVLLLIFKLWAGFASHSRALVADGIHTLSDLFTDLIVLVGLKMGRKEEDALHPYGHARIETLAALIVGALLMASGFWISINGFIDISKGNRSHPTTLALWAALISIAVKEVLYRYTVRVGKRIRSQALISNAWHHRSDAFSSVAVLLGVGAGIISPRLAVLDIYAAILVSFFMIKVGASISFEAAKEVIDTSPDKAVIERIRACALSVKDVRDATYVRARTSGGSIITEIHISVDPNLTVAKGHDVAEAVEDCVRSELSGVVSVVIHVDPYYVEKLER